MTALGLLERVKGWFGGKDEAGGNGRARPKRPASGPPQEGAAYLAGGKAQAATTVLGAAASPAVSDLDPRPPTLEPRPSALDPLDPAWMQSLEDLPVRAAESAAERAAATRALEQVAEELQGHRQTTRVLAAAIRRLPDIATNHVELTRETNQILQRQSAALESMLDGQAALQAAFNTVEESSRRHLKAITLLESSHRQILFEYQTMFLRSHRLVGILAAIAVILAAGALGAAAYIGWHVFVVP
jgi:hypothetical protein